MLLSFRDMDKNGRNKVLKLNRILYELNQIPGAFWEYNLQNINEYVCPKTNTDPCLYINDKVVAVCYVDSILFWSSCGQYILDLVE